MTDAERRWWPYAIAQDEHLPDPRATPTDWIVGPAEVPATYRVAGDMYFAYGDDPADGEGAQQVPIGGLIEFIYCEDRDDTTVRIHADGRFDLLGAAPASDATDFQIKGEAESWGDSLAELARNWATDAGGGFPRVETVRACFWSDPIAHRLDLVDGKPVFIRVEIGHA